MNHPFYQYLTKTEKGKKILVSNVLNKKFQEYYISNYFKHLTSLPYPMIIIEPEIDTVLNFIKINGENQWLGVINYKQEFKGLNGFECEYCDFTIKSVEVIIRKEGSNYSAYLDNVNVLETTFLEDKISIRSGQGFPGFKTYYKIQLIASKSVSPEQDIFNQVRELGGKLTKEHVIIKGTNRIMLGDFMEENEARLALKKIKKLGFEDAFIVKYIQGKRLMN